MEYRLLGRSGLKISTITLGTMTFGGTGDFAAVGNTDLDTARRQVDLALDAGVNLIDTADVYSAGLSEEIVGAALAGRRDAALLTTKVRFPMGDGPNDEGLSRHHIISGCEASLRRLRTDYLDLYQLHEWDGQTPLEETLAALDHLVSAGKVRYVGVSNFAGWQLLKTVGAARHGGFPPIVSQQIHYTLQAREAEYELVPAAVDSGIGILVWSPLAGGLLSGKYRRGQEPPTGARDLAAWGEPPVRDQEALYDIVEVLVDIATGLGVSPAEVALAWTLSRPGVTSLVIGARTDDQLRTNLRAADLTLSTEDIDRLEQASRPPLLYPYWHQAGSAAARLSEADLTLLRRHLS
jgi:aryl-alcohol dehydrogenase-like predicted oxidoreductase